MQHDNKQYLVVGLGITGLSVVEYLSAQNANLAVTDSSANPTQLATLQQKFPLIPVFTGAIVVPPATTHIVLSPGVALSTSEIQAALQRGVTVLGDIELFAQAVDKPVLAVTGSNGKSTVTTLLGAMAQASGISAGVGGNLGTPALALLNPTQQCYILELSSFQLETTISLRSQVATILNVSPDHMDRYTNPTAYQRAKQRIYTNAECAVVNRQDTLTAVPDHLEPAILSFGLDQALEDHYGVIQHQHQAWLAKGATLLMPVQSMAMLGAHNVGNALAALAMGDVAGFKLSAMLDTLRTFTGLEHRCEPVLHAQDVVWVNDSKGTNVAATLAAIQGLENSIPGKWVIVLGGLGKNADFMPLVAPIAKTCRAAILIGTEAKQLATLLQNSVQCFMARDLTEVVQIAAAQTQAGDGVLFSPACASFDMFNNYMHRGQVFKQQVLESVQK